MKTTSAYLVCSLTLFLVGGCGGTSLATPESGAKPGILSLNVSVGESVPNSALEQVVIVELILSAADPGSPLPLKPFVDFATWDGVPVATQVRDEDGDGNLDLVISFSGNPFVGRRAFALLLAQESVGGGDGGTTPAMKVKSRLYATIAPGGVTQTAIIAQGEATLDTTGASIAFGAQDRSVNVSVQCVNAEFCSFIPTADGGVVNVESNSVNVTVTRRASCPTNQFVGDLYVFLLPNPLATPFPDRKGVVRVGFDFTEPVGTNFTIDNVPLGTYYAVAVLDVGGEFARNNFAYQDLDIINALPVSVDVFRGEAAHVTLTLDQVVNRGPCSGESPPSVTVRRLANCGVPATLQGDLWVFAQGSNGSVAHRVPGVDLRTQTMLIPDVVLPPLPAGSYVVSAALDINPGTGTSFNPGDGDLLSTPVALTVPSQEPPLITLDQAVGGVGCTDGINVNGAVVDEYDQPYGQAIVKIFEVASGRERYALSLGDGTFNFPGVDASLGYDLSVRGQASGGGLDGMISWLGVPATMSTPRVKLPDPFRNTNRFATLNVTINTTGGELITASNYFDLQRATLTGTGGPQMVMVNLNWSGPASIPIVVATAEGAPTTRISAFGIRSLVVTNGSTASLTLATAIPADRPITVNLAGGPGATFPPVLYPMIELNGIRLPLPGTPTDGVPANVTRMVPDTNCAGCVQYVAVKQASTDFAAQGRCLAVSEGRVAVPAGAAAVTANMPDLMSFISPALPPAGSFPSQVTRPHGFVLAPHSFSAVWLTSSGQGDPNTDTSAFTSQLQGTFPEMVGLGLRTDEETVRIFAMGIGDPNYTPEATLRDGTLGFAFPFDPCSPSALPERRLGPGVQTGYAITEASVVP